MAMQIQLRRSSAGDWTSANPILAQGEMGIELDTNRFKIGNGVDRWADLPYTGFADQGTDPSNWDQNSKLGLYYVNRQSWSGTVGTPTETDTVGLLAVFVSGGAIVQKYQPGNVGSSYGSEYIRSRIGNASWTAWTRTVADGGFLDGGSY